MFIKHIFLILTLSLFGLCAMAEENRCSRTVQINGENIAIDASSTQKGEGLRYYLDKDPIALQYFEQYISQNKPNWRRIGISTAGMGLMIAGFLSSNDTSSDFLKRDTLLASGAGIVILSFLYAKTKQSEREVWLEKSVNEYNKRNKPSIILNPQYHPGKKSWGLFLSREY